MRWLRRRKLYGDACLGVKNLQMIEICRWNSCAFALFFFYNLHTLAFHSKNNKKQQTRKHMASAKKDINRWNPSISTWTHLTTPCLSGVVSVPWSSQGAAVRCLAYVVPRWLGVSRFSNRWEGRGLMDEFVLTKCAKEIYIYSFFPSDFTNIKCKFIW